MRPYPVRKYHNNNDTPPLTTLFLIVLLLLLLLSVSVSLSLEPEGWKPLASITRVKPAIISRISAPPPVPVPPKSSISVFPSSTSSSILSRLSPQLTASASLEISTSPSTDSYLLHQVADNDRVSTRSRTNVRNRTISSGINNNTDSFPYQFTIPRNHIYYDPRKFPRARLTSVLSSYASGTGGQLLAGSKFLSPAITVNHPSDHRTNQLINRVLSANLAHGKSSVSGSSNNNNNNIILHRSDQPTTVLPETFYQQELNRRLQSAGYASRYSFLPVISNRNEYRRQTAHLNLNAIRPTDGSNIDVDLRDLIHKELEERSKIDPILSPRGASQSGSLSSPSSSSSAFHPGNNAAGVNLFALLRPNNNDVQTEGKRRGGDHPSRNVANGQSSDHYDAISEDSEDDPSLELDPSSLPGMTMSSSSSVSIGNRRGGTHKPSMSASVPSSNIDHANNRQKMDGIRVGDRIVVRKNSSDPTTATTASGNKQKTKKKTNGHSHAPQKEISLIPLVPNPDSSPSSPSSSSSSGVLQQNHRHHHHHLNQPNMPTTVTVTSSQASSGEEDSFTSTSLSSSTSISLSPGSVRSPSPPHPDDAAAAAAPSSSSSSSSATTSRSPDQSGVSQTSSDQQYGHDSENHKHQQQNHHQVASDKIQRQQQQQNPKQSEPGGTHNGRQSNNGASMSGGSSRGGNHAPAGSQNHHHFDSSSSGSSNINPKVVAFVTHVDPPPTRFPRPTRHRTRYPSPPSYSPPPVSDHYVPNYASTTTPISVFQIPDTSSTTTTTSSSGILPTYTEKPPTILLVNSRKPADWSTRNHHQQPAGNSASDIVRKYYEEIIKNSKQLTQQQPPPATTHHRPRAGVSLPTTIPGTVPANSTETINLGSNDNGHNNNHHQTHDQDPGVMVNNNHLNDEDSESGNSADGSAHVNSAVPTMDPTTGEPMTTISPKSTTSPSSSNTRDDEVIDFIFGLSGKEDQPYRMTTERLAYILIGSCCALSILCLIIVAFSIRCRDMCDEYRAWKKAEKLAVYSHLRYNQQQQQQQQQQLHQYPFTKQAVVAGVIGGNRHHASSQSQSLQLQQQQHQQQQSSQSQQRHHVMRMNGGRNATTSAGIETLHDPYGPNETDSSLLPLPPPPPLLHSNLIHHQHPGLPLQQSNTSRPIFGPSCCCCPPSTSSNFTARRGAAALTAGKRQSSSDSCPRGYFHPTPRGKLPFGAASSLHQLFPSNNRSILVNQAHHGNRAAGGGGSSMSDHMEEGDSLDSMIEHDHDTIPQECTCSEPVYVDLAQQVAAAGQHQRKKGAAAVYKHHQSKNNHQHGEPAGQREGNPSWIQSSIIVDELHRKHANLRTHNGRITAGHHHAAASTAAGVIGHRVAAAGGGRGNNVLQSHANAPTASGSGGSPAGASSGNRSNNNNNARTHHQLPGNRNQQQPSHRQHQQNPKQGRYRSDQPALKFKKPEDALIFWSGNDDRLI